MSEYIVKESGYSGELKQEIVGELVRCKDCKEYQTDWEPSVPNRHFCAVMDSMMKPMDYCSYGERQKDGR